MSLSEKQVIEKIADVDFGQGPRVGWQDAVRRQIRREDHPTHLKLVELHPAEPRRRARSFSLAMSGFALAAAVVLSFVIVQDEKSEARLAERTTAIAMVVEFVELESEMAEALAEIDLTQARMDEAFRDLQYATAELSPTVVEPSSAAASSQVPGASSRHGTKGAQNMKSKAKARVKKAKADESNTNDPLAGL